MARDPFVLLYMILVFDPCGHFIIAPRLCPQAAPRYSRHSLPHTNIPRASPARGPTHLAVRGPHAPILTILRANAVRP